MVELKNLELEMFSFFEMTPDLVCIAGRDGYFKKINPAVSKTLGYTNEELFSKPISSFIHPDDKDITSRERAKLLNGKTLLNFQNRYLTKNGGYVWLEWTSIFLPDKDVVFAIAKDITKGKLAEQEIEEKYKRFKSLATHFKSNIESNRKYLAAELHEEMAQLAAVIKMDVDLIGSKENSLSEQSKKTIEHAQAACNILINTIRRISFSISPNMLNDLGLNATLEWQCREFSILNGIPCSFKADYDESRLTEEMKLDFFRICQEALTNIMCHAEANNVTISIADYGANISLTIVDDGKGFDLEKKKEGLGLISMEKRAASINSELTIKSVKGKGTEIKLSVARQ